MKRCRYGVVGKMVQNSPGLYSFIFNAVVIHEDIYLHSTSKSLRLGFDHWKWENNVKTGNGIYLFVTMTSWDVTYFRESRNVEKMFQTLCLSQIGACLSSYNISRACHYSLVTRWDPTTGGTWSSSFYVSPSPLALHQEITRNKQAEMRALRCMVNPTDN